MKKVLLLVGIAPVLLALPATAPAAEWQDGTTGITTRTTIKLTGPIGFESIEAGGISCKTAHVEIVLNPGEHGSITKFEPTGCTTHGPLHEVFGCIVESVTSTATEFTPWSATAEPLAIAITGIGITIHSNLGCLLGPEIVIANNMFPVVALPDSIWEIHDVSLVNSVETSFGPSAVEGFLTVEPAGTYGIG